LTSLFAHNFNIDKVVIAGIEFNVSVDIISSATCIPDHGETWFKGMELDLDDYKLFLKPNVKMFLSMFFLSDICLKIMLL
jgi:hypothetical protein